MIIPIRRSQFDVNEFLQLRSNTLAILYSPITLLVTQKTKNYSRDIKFKHITYMKDNRYSSCNKSIRYIKLSLYVNKIYILFRILETESLDIYTPGL